MNEAIGNVCTHVKGGLDPQKHSTTTFAHYSLPAFDSGVGPVLEYGESIHSQKTPIPNEVVLVSKLNPRIPRVWYVNDAQVAQRICSTEFVPLQPNRDRLDGCYLAYALREALQGGAIKGNTAAATKSRERAKPTDFLGLKIKLPSIAEQRRIVDLLLRAENIVRMRREAEAKAKAIIPALFVDMFGDPSKSTHDRRRWASTEAVPFGELGTLDRGRSRHRPRDAAHLYGGNMPFIQTGDVAQAGGVINFHTQSYSEAGVYQSRVWPKGTLCITIAANIANTGVLGFDACFPDSVVGFLPGPRVRTEYIQEWLGFLRPTLEAQAPRAAQKNINLEILRNLKVPVPPIAEQDRFALRVESVRSLQRSNRGAAGLAARAFESLLAGVFGEEL